MQFRFCFDVDGTLCENITENKGYDQVEPLPGAIETLRMLREQGHYIILLTARHMRTTAGDKLKSEQMGRQLLENWLEKYNVPYDELHFGKPHSTIFIDDKGFKHENWEDTGKYLGQLIKDNGNI